jgi:heptosyltransferase-2
MPFLIRRGWKRVLFCAFGWLGHFVQAVGRYGRRLVGTKVQEGEPRRIFWLNIWGLGDTVLMIPALASLRERYPEAEITVLVQPEFEQFVRSTGYADRCVTVRVPWAERSGKYRPAKYLRRSFWRLVRELRKQRFDLAIDAHMDPRNNVFLWLIGAKRRLGFDYGGGCFLMTDLVKPDLSRPHHCDMALQLVQYLGGKVVLEEPHLPISLDDSQRADVFWATAGFTGEDIVVGIHPGAGSPVRRWGLDRFAQVADALADRYPVKFLCIAQPDGYGSDLRLRAPYAVVAPDLGLLAALLARCSVLLCNDSGPMHLSCAVGTPVVAVFGPSEPAWWAPKGSNNELVILEGFACRPCQDICRYPEPYCLTLLPVEMVTEAVARVLDRILTAKGTTTSRPQQEMYHRGWAGSS